MELTARNRRRSSRKLKVGALVKLFKKPKAKKHAKLWRTWQGPYRVLKVYNEGATADIKHVASDEVLSNQSLEFIGLYFEKDNTAVPEEEAKQPNYDGKSYVVEKIVGDKGGSRGGQTAQGPLEGRLEGLMGARGQFELSQAGGKVSALES